MLTIYSKKTGSIFRADMKESHIPEGIEVETIYDDGVDFYAIMGSTFWRSGNVLIHKSNAQFGIFSSFCQDREPQIRAFLIDRNMTIEFIDAPWGEYKCTWQLRIKQ